MKGTHSIFRLPRTAAGRFATVLACCVGLAALASGCGASIKAVYEGNVRFEHCMALDAQPDVLPSIRRACWVEWVAFYTYGQTRDRVVHAQLRIDQLSDVSDFVRPEPGANGQPAEQPPYSTGAPPAAPSAPAAPNEQAGGAPSAVCASECSAVRDDCMADCGSVAACRKSCAVRFNSCMRACA